MKRLSLVVLLAFTAHAQATVESELTALATALNALADVISGVSKAPVVSEQEKAFKENLDRLAAARDAIAAQSTTQTIQSNLDGSIKTSMDYFIAQKDNLLPEQITQVKITLTAIKDRIIATLQTSANIANESTAQQVLNDIETLFDNGIAQYQDFLNNLTASDQTIAQIKENMEAELASGQETEEEPQEPEQWEEEETGKPLPLTPPENVIKFIEYLTQKTVQIQQELGKGNEEYVLQFMGMLGRISPKIGSFNNIQEEIETLNFKTLDTAATAAIDNYITTLKDGMKNIKLVDQKQQQDIMDKISSLEDFINVEKTGLD